MEEEVQRELLQLLPSQSHPLDSSPSSLRLFRSAPPHRHHPQPEGQSSTTTTSVDLQLSISLGPIKGGGGRGVEAAGVKWEAAEQIRMAAMEKAYAERVREVTRREMEMAKTELERARRMWERAREEVEKAERMKERASKQIDSTCMQFTCQSCRQRFNP